MEVERRRGVAGPRRDGAQACPLQPFGGEHLARRLQDERALVVADRLPPFRPPNRHVEDLRLQNS